MNQCNLPISWQTDLRVMSRFSHKCLVFSGLWAFNFSIHGLFVGASLSEFTSTMRSSGKTAAHGFWSFVEANGRCVKRLSRRYLYQMCQEAQSAISVSTKESFYMWSRLHSMRGTAATEFEEIRTTEFPRLLKNPFVDMLRCLEPSFCKCLHALERHFRCLTHDT